MARKSKPFIIFCMLPALVAYISIYAYPLIRTLLMSFFRMTNPSSTLSEWTYVGLGNFSSLLQSSLFLHSLENIGKIWLYGGLGVMAFALLFAVILTSGIRFKSFFRAAIYLPNIITAVAMANMWLHYAFNVKYGLFKNLFTFLGFEKMASFPWTAPENTFLSLMLAYGFGCIGYYMLIFTAGIEKIPQDIYSSALLDGSGKVKSFFHITLPLLKGVFRTALTLWTTGTLGFFVWAQMFAPLGPEKSIITPVVYLYSNVFGTEAGRSTSDLNAGLGAAICLLLMAIAAAVFALINRVIKDDHLEY